MTRASLYELLLATLNADQPLFYSSMTPEVAYERLKQKTGQDFGYDIQAWEKWLDDNVDDWRFATRPHPRMNLLDEVQEIFRTLIWAAREYIKGRRP